MPCFKVSGRVLFEPNGDRLVPFDVWNPQLNASTGEVVNKLVAVFNPFDSACQSLAPSPEIAMTDQQL